MNFEAALAAVRRARNDIDALDDLARAALEAGEERDALGWLQPAAEKANSALLWQWVGLLHRALDEHELALDAFRRASELAPNDPAIAHGYARVTLEAGLDAVDRFLRAQSLAPGDGSVLLGLAAARNAIGQGQIAADELTAVLEQAPGWLDGYEPLAQLLSTLGDKDRASEQLNRAIARFPREEGLWLTLFGLDVRREDFATLGDRVAQAAAAGVSPETLAFHRAIVAGELEGESFPPAMFEHAPAAAAPRLAVWRVRHLLRVGEIAAAVVTLEEALAPDSAGLWPYAATAWRLSGDERSQWLEDDPRLIRVSDLSDRLPRINELAEGLRQLHIAKGEYLDQSVRGGTQTDGPLLSRIDPLIRALRSAIVSAVEEYVAALPPPDPKHPLLRRRRDREVRFSGSWSVRLRSSGKHSNHVHPQGWISSALYIALPERRPGDPDDAGWLTLGEPPENLGVDLGAWKKVEPKPAHLALFPSWMWHGTRPFAEGERLTVAFDVRPPI
jgi:tetratricopeptide (TPR) repeat protein